MWLYTLLVLGFFYRPLTTQTVYLRDIYQYFYPKRLFLAAALRAGELPLWDPTTHGGMPFLANPAAYAFHPSNVLYLLMPTVTALNVVLVLHVLFCAVAAYWLARVLALSTPAAFVTGIAYAFCGFTLSTVSLTYLLLGLPWVPLTLGLLHRGIAGRRSPVPVAVAAAMPMYGGAAELTVILFAVVGLWALTTCTSWRRRLIAAALVIAGGAGLTLLQVLPATSVIAQSRRSEKQSYESFSSWSVAPQRLPELFVPRFLGDTDTLSEEGYWGRTLESNGFPYILSLYLGVPLLLLAAAGARARPMLAALALVAVVVSLGRHMPGFRLLYELPLVATFRFPVKAMAAVPIAVAILAGHGVERLRGSSRPLTVSAAILAAIAVLGALGGWPLDAFSFAPLTEENRTALAWSFAHAAVAALAFAIASWRASAVAVAVIVAVDLLVAGWSVNDYAPRAIYDEPQVAAAARAAAGEGRFHAAARPMILRAPSDDLMWLARWHIATLSGYDGAMFGLRTVYHEDHDGLAPRRMALLANAIERVPWDRRVLLLDRADARAFLTSDGVLHKRPHAAPARFVSSAVVAAGERDAARRLLAQRDLSTVVLEDQGIATGGCGEAAVHRTSNSLNRATYVVDAPCDGVVVLAENHYDGWSARVDGRPARHLRADYAFTAVAVGPGRHVIERSYFPPLLAAGAVGTVLTLLALFVAPALLRDLRA